MAWAFVGVSNVVEVTATSHPLVTTGIAGTLQAGDLLVACISSRIASTTSVTLPTGGAWTLVSEQKNNNVLATNSAAPSGLMAYCVRGASNPNLTFTHPTAPSVAIGRIIAYRDVVQTTPKDTQTSFTTATAQTAVSGTGLTTTQADDLIVAMAAGGQEAAWSSFNATSPAGASGATSTAAPTTTWLERADSLTTTGVDTSLAIFDAIKTAAGATGNLTATASVAAAHVVIAGAFKIAPPPATGTGTPAAQESAVIGVGTVLSANVWSSIDKSANVTLSNSDKTAILSSSVTAGVRSTQRRTSGAVGKFYVELVINAANPFGVQVGFSSIAQSVTATTDAIRVNCDDGTVFFGASIIDDAWTAEDGAGADGDVICLAWDTSAKHVWVRLNSLDWNDNASADPATGVGGALASTPDAVDYALWMRAANSGRGATLRTEAAELTYTGPSGFTSWMGEALPTPSITGTGALVAESAAVAGAGEAVVSDITGTGALAAQAADADGAGTVSGLPDAWNSADKSANITLSNNDKTATLSAAVTSGVRSTTKYLNGTETNKFYVEFFLTNAISGFSCQVGIREVSAALNTSAGSTFQCATNSGNIVTGSATTVGNIGGAPLLDNDIVCMAWSPSTERGWFRKNGGLWNNDAAANPATNTNGLDISALNNTDHALLFLAASSLNGASVTVRTEAADLTYSAPSGFVSWMGETLAATGTGALAAQSSAASGTGVVSTAEATGTGSLEAQTAAVAGAGLSVSDGDGAANAQAAAVAGTGAVASSGAGALVSDVAAVGGAGVSISDGTGNAAAEPAAVAGTGSAAAANSGALVAESAAVSGDGVSSSIGVGVLAADAALIVGVGLSVSTGSGALACSPVTVEGVGVVLEEGVAVGTGELLAGAATISGEGEVTGEVAVPPVYGGYHYRPDRRPKPVEGYGYGILPQIEGEAHGSVGAVGRSIGALPRFAGLADAAAGAAGSSSARLTVKAAALGNAGTRGRGSGMIVKFEGVAAGRHDDDEAAIVAWLLAA